MDEIDSSFSNPFAQLRSIRRPAVIFRNANGAPAAERGKYVSHESVKHGRHKLAHPAARPQSESLNFPADEMVDGLAPSSNRFGLAGRPGCKEDITQIITVKILQMARTIARCAGGSVHRNHVQ